ncbi:protoporphyrinogen oxidase [Bacillus sp. FJAT-27231]|uniref:protoporphyrinogen oxidase n=1 Tax=Bacillus sp. FJAT-27231 TaxID=1679168 RepID=UPI0006714EC2|nr:protoporphyrinogen oxidase [Bacillus sp. FJAT-27231]KMY53181.1 protoporphyrinogen oxidase [Bacillus sp. FJAT-27231]
MLGEKKRVVVVGGGITGLTAAYYLQKAAKTSKLPLAVTLIEATPRLGGKIRTVKKNGFIIEKGPDSFLARKESAIRLAKEVGLGDQLVNSKEGRPCVLVNGKLHPIPEGSIVGVPTKITPFLTTNLFSVAGKVRAGADFFLPKMELKNDISLGGFFRRRLGDEVVEHLIEPLLSRVYAGDIDKLSLMATLPQLYKVGQEHRSLILGAKQIAAALANESGGFLTLKAGLEELVEGIEERLEGGSVLKGIRVKRIDKREGEKFVLSLNDGGNIIADGVVLATSHLTLPFIMPQYGFFDSLKEMPSMSIATVAMAFPKEVVSRHIDGTGFVVSRNNDVTITACTWVNKRWPHAVPEGKALLRCYVGRAGDEAIVDLSDAEIEQIVIDDLKKIISLSSKPDFTVVSRWKHAIPQYTIGHKERLDTIEEQIRENLPGLFIAGSSFRGLSIPDCIEQGEAAAQQAAAFISKL